eukprot:6710066-Prymnesium_polylepis.1
MALLTASVKGSENFPRCKSWRTFACARASSDRVAATHEGSIMTGSIPEGIAPAATPFAKAISPLAAEVKIPCRKVPQTVAPTTVQSCCQVRWSALGNLINSEQQTQHVAAGRFAV